jgi:hypothetical protein
MGTVGHGVGEPNSHFGSTIESCPCDSEVQMSLKREFFLWKTLRDDEGLTTEARRHGGKGPRHRLLAFGFWLLAFGFWLLAFGFWLLAFGFRLSAFGFWLLAFGFRLSAFGS